jgi:hypothetical protein
MPLITPNQDLVKRNPRQQRFSEHSGLENHYLRASGGIATNKSLLCPAYREAAKKSKTAPQSRKDRRINVGTTIYFCLMWPLQKAARDASILRL